MSCIDVDEVPGPDASILTGSDLGRMLGQQRTIVEVACREPGCTRVVSGTLCRRFCSDACKMRNYRRRLAMTGPYESIPPID